MNAEMSDASLYISGTLGLDQLVLGDWVYYTTGGSAAYAGMAANYHSSSTVLVAGVGMDFPNEFMTVLENHSIDTRLIAKSKEDKSYYWHGQYGQELTDVTTVHFDLNMLKTYRPVIDSVNMPISYMGIASLPLTIQQQIVEQLDAGQTFIALATAPNLISDSDTAVFRSLLNKCHVASLNTSELFLISGKATEAAAVEEILSYGPEYLILTKGKKGACLFGSEMSLYLPVMNNVVVRDPTGAGDAFFGGFMGCLSAHKGSKRYRVVDAFIAGSVMASFCIEGIGTLGLQDLDKDQIMQRIHLAKQSIEVLAT